MINKKEKTQEQDNIVTLDRDVIVGYPTRDEWGAYYSKFRKPLVMKLNWAFSLHDREDAVEAAFDKLMNKKDPLAYGEKMPCTEAKWFWALYWQAKAYLSHMMEHRAVHSKYVEKMSKELKGVFDPGFLGDFMDEEVYSEALARALDTFRKDQDMSRRNLEIFTALAIRGESVKSVAARFSITENNAYQVKMRVGKLFRKHGAKYFKGALGHASMKLFRDAS